jgi:preprotein translocase subunit SecG
MYLILLVIHVVIALMLIGLILIQHGKGAQTGAAFGSGASQTVFGSQGSGGFLSRATAMLAAAFFILNLFLVFYLNRAHRQQMPEGLPATMKETTTGKIPPQPPAPGKGTDVPEVNE